MLTIYKTAFGFVGRNPAFFLVLSALMFGFTLLSEISWAGTVTGFIVWAAIVYSLHRGLMFDEVNLFEKSNLLKRPRALGRFLLVYFILMAIIILSTLVFAIYAFDSITLMQSDPLFGIGVFVVTFCVIYVMITCCFGTSLPAAAAADRCGPRISLKRARETFWRMLLGLLAGPVLYFLVGISIILALENNFGLAIILAEEIDFNDPIAMLIHYLLELFSLFQALLNAAVLKLTYERVAPIEIQTAMGTLEDHAEIFA